MTKAAEQQRRADRLVGAFKRNKFENHSETTRKVIRRVQILTGASRRQQGA